MTGFFRTAYDASLLSAALVFLVLGILVARSRITTAHTRAWSAMCFLTSVLIISIKLVTTTLHSATLALLVARVGFTAGASAGLAFFYFAVTFLGLRAQLRKALSALEGVFALCLVLFWVPRVMVRGIEPLPHGISWPVPGPLFPLYGLYSAVTVVFPVVLFIRALRRTRGRVRLQLAYLLVAVSFIAVGGLGTLLPAFQRNSPAAFLPILFLVFGPTIITYAIIRHRLWDIRTVIHKTVLWAAASSVVLVPAYVVLRYHSAWLLRAGATGAAVSALALFGVFGLHFRVVQPWLDYRFGRRAGDPLRVLTSFNREVLNLRGERELGELVEDTLRPALHAASVGTWVVEQDSGRLRRIGNGAGNPWSLSGDLRAWLVDRDDAVDAAVLPDTRMGPELKTALHRDMVAQGVAVTVPLIREGRLLALVCLGEKQNLRAYTREDFQLLEQIRAPATVALANAQLYDRLQELTRNLEGRVEQRTRELQRANEKLLDLDQAKSRFFENVTHELRTPLTLIVAPLEDLLLRREALPAPLAEEVQTMHRNALRLLRLISGLLDLARSDAGELRLKAAPLHLNQLAEASVRSFRALAARKGLSLDFEPLAGEDLIVGDLEKLELVFANLLANAVKFTPEGGSVWVRMERDEAWVSIGVEDTGIGIPEDQLDHIFDRFGQVESGAARRFEGAGIGLALVKEIVGLHQGAISVSSKLGAGSAFRVRLHQQLAPLPASTVDRREVDLPTGHARRAADRDPVSWVPWHMEGDAWITVEARTPRESAAPSNGGRRARVMVVEDNPDMRSYLARRIGDKYEVVACANGQEALAAVAAHPPAVVLADVMMPELSGYELCRKLKQNAATAAIPVILVTARKGADRTLEGFQAGADDYLTKPFNFQELQARIAVQLRLVEMGRALAQREKTAVLNLVAAGLAHEVRNPVNAIVNAARPLREAGFLQGLPADLRKDAAELLGVILESAERIDVLISDFLGVSRPHLEEMSDWKLEEALDSTVRLLQHKLGRQLRVERSFRHTAPVFGRTAHLNQVLMNLLDNAVRAAGPEGQVWVETEERSGAFCLRVRDSGKGVPPGMESRVFDPLFTTRASPDSTGLGLYITRRIVEEHQGRITVRSTPGAGAEFTVEIPQRIES